MSLKLYRWNNYVVPGAYPGRLQFIDPDEWTPYLDRHLTEVDEGTVPEKQLLRLWAEAGQTAESFDDRHGTPEGFSPDPTWLDSLLPRPITDDPLYVQTPTIPDEPPGEYAGGTF